ncbi:MAG: hypothetical protein A3F41_01220 [Coxiella sp. RIFCSPHIGHO2_12_FULL_44_14]|nr:MAG: hypothetical protein A3F41_01220 [Coxiella sp. RIFCSPHIGHO2_12_FULL_44_14]
MKIIVFSWIVLGLGLLGVGQAEAGIPLSTQPIESLRLGQLEAGSMGIYPQRMIFDHTTLVARVFVFDPRQHRWYAYDNGQLVGSGRAAGGAGYCRDIGRSCRTPTGTYRIIHKGSAHCRSTRYPRPHGGARMDYCMFFSKYYAIHGSNDVPSANVSHGCVRVKPEAARWLHGNFMQIGTKVVVKSY